MIKVNNYFKLAFITLLIMNVGCYQPKIIAHRGYWKAAQNAQNSIEGIKKADYYKFYGSEFDIQLTKDNIPIIYHDNTIDGIKINRLLYKDIKDLKLKNGENISTLENFIISSKFLNNIQLIAELKSQETAELEEILVEKTIALIHKYDLQKRTNYISFSANICDLIKLKAPNAHVQYLRGNLTPKQIKDRGWDGLDYHYNILLENKSWVKQAHKLGLSTNAWTVNDEEVFKALKNLKIQMITTDEPLKFKKQ